MHCFIKYHSTILFFDHNTALEITGLKSNNMATHKWYASKEIFECFPKQHVHLKTFSAIIATRGQERKIRISLDNPFGDHVNTSLVENVAKVCFGMSL